jgi:hypothetical protein
MGTFYGQNIQRPTNNGASLYKGSPILRDFQHASKIFRPNGYALAPKLKFLFHVYFDINQTAYDKNFNNGDNFGLLVKTVKLPSYNITTHELNQYNRKRVVQTKIKYDPVNISFHDDSDNTITSLWEAYYTYYYKDGTNFDIFANQRGGLTRPSSGTLDSQYNSRNIYESSNVIQNKNNWGYVGETYGSNVDRKNPFFKTITIFGFNRHLFTAYTLINPMITRFSHDTYSYSEGGGTMEMQMDLQYETVVYNEGAMDGKEPGNIVKGFGLEESYDKTLSPLTPAGSESLVPGQGGYTPSNGGFVQPRPGSY